MDRRESKLPSYLPDKLASAHLQGGWALALELVVSNHSSFSHSLLILKTTISTCWHVKLLVAPLPTDLLVALDQGCPNNNSLIRLSCGVFMLITWWT